MVRINLQFFGGRGSSSVSPVSKKLVGAVAPALDKKLVERANAAGTVIDYGTSTQKAYERYVNEIKTFDLSEVEKNQAYTKLHSLVENQLRAEASAVSPYVSGPARFNRNQVVNNAERAASERAKTTDFMERLREKSLNRKRESEVKSFNDAAVSAFKSGKLEFTYDGKTYRRRSIKSKTFTLIR